MEEIKPITNALNQELRKGDIVLAFEVHRPRIFVIREIKTKPAWDDKVVSKRYSKILGVEIHGSYRMDYTVQPSRKTDEFIISVRKRQRTNLNSVFKINNAFELSQYGFDGRLVATVNDEQRKTMNGEYDKKKKKDDNPATP